MGNFLDEQMGANGEKIYKLRDHMRLSMLRRMNRKYTKEQYLALVEKMKARIPGIQNQSKTLQIILLILTI